MRQHRHFDDKLLQDIPIIYFINDNILVTH
jgi:hypothetical protein